MNQDRAARLLSRWRIRTTGGFDQYSGHAGGRKAKTEAYVFTLP